MTPSRPGRIFSAVGVARGRGDRRALVLLAETGGGVLVDSRQVKHNRAIDTSPEMERVLVERYRRMDGREKLRRVASLNRSVERLAAARIRAQYGDGITDREMRLRLATLRLGRRLMIKAFGWDPQDEGY